MKSENTHGASPVRTRRGSTIAMEVPLFAVGGRRSGRYPPSVERLSSRNLGSGPGSAPPPHRLSWSLKRTGFDPTNSPYRNDFAKRKPKQLFKADGSTPARRAERQYEGRSPQHPPR